MSGTAIVLFVVALLVLVLGYWWAIKGAHFRVRISHLKKVMLIWLIFVAPAIYLSYGSISTDLVTFLLLLINIVVAVPFLLAMIMVILERKRL